MVDLTARPYFLDEDSIRWVRDTIASMSTEEKIGQLFFNMGASREEDYLRMTVEKYHIGGVRYNTGPSREIWQQNYTLQKYAKIPMFIACNTEAGGNGACTDGTFLGYPVKIGATGDEKYAYELGRISNKEAASVGCNLSFSPLSDINQNWRNPIISSRCFSNDTDTVCRMTQAYFKGAHENTGFACAAKHFPGDGLDERDQHLSPSVNSADCDTWMNTYGKVYQGLIDQGLEAIMAGHIMQPAWTRAINPDIRDEDIMPATLSSELLQGLLRGKLGFNGMILTDASHMVGLTCMKKRSDLLPAAIAAGCDMFLFFNDMEEDFGYMMEGYRRGIITEERLQDALERILGLKASMGLHRMTLDQMVPSADVMKATIGCDEHRAMAAEIADKCVTLVKNKDNVFPLTPEKYKRILLVPVKGAVGGGVFSMMHQKKGPSTAEKVADRLRRRGFEVEIYEDPLARLLRERTEEEARAKREGRELPPDDGKALMAYYAGKTPIERFVSRQDLVLTLSEVNCPGQTAERVSWAMSKGGGEIPWYVHELPVVVASVGHPFLLADVPQARTFINAYDATEPTLDALVSKLCGESEFTGVDPVDAFCGMWDTHM